MSIEDEDKYKKYSNPYLSGEDEESESGESGSTGSSTGSSGQIEFRDFTLPAGRLRDDQMPPDVKKHALLVHESLHKIRVEKQKEKRDQNKQLKEGKIPLQEYRQGKGYGNGNGKPRHPVLDNKAQFSGSVDDQVKNIPNDVADTNDDKREKLEYQYNLRYQPEGPVPHFNPRPPHG